MADQVFLYDDFIVGYVFPLHRYSIDAAQCDAFIKTFSHSAVRAARGTEIPIAAQQGVVRPAHPALVASFQPMHGVLKWPPGVVHAREKLTIGASVFPGEPLQARISVKDRYVKNDRKFVVLEIAIQKLENKQIAIVAERTLVWPE